MGFFDIYVLIAVFTFYALLVGKTVILMRRGRRVVQLGKGKEGFGKHLERSFWLGMGLLTFFVVMAAFRIPYPGIGEPISLFGGTWSKITGFFLLNAAIVSFSFALAAFRDAFRIGIEESAAETLVTEGIFRYSRNPVYLAVILLFAGCFLVYPDPFFLGSLLFVTVAFRHQSKKEEKKLAREFPKSYAVYLARTRKWFGPPKKD